MRIRFKHPLTASLMVANLVLISILSWRLFHHYSSARNLPSPQDHLESQPEPFDLLDVDDAPLMVIKNDVSPSLHTAEKCGHSNCFDLYRCDTVLNGHIRVYVYPIRKYVDSSGVSISKPFSREFQEIIEAIVSSPFYTSNAKEACLFVPALDFLTQESLRLEESSQVLNSLLFWGRTNGSNHLIFNFIPGTFPEYKRRLEIKTGRAIIASGGFDTSTFRSGFDVAIPVFSPNNSGRSDPKNERWYLLIPQADVLTDKIKNTVIDLELGHSEKVFLISSRCLPNKRRSKSGTKCNHYRKRQVNYPDILTQGTFCMFSESSRLSSPILSDIMMSGCIPVISCDECILPFEEKIDWTKAVVRIRENQVPLILSILDEISAEKRHQMKRYSLYVFKTYFSSIKVITLTTLQIINERLVPYSVITNVDREHEDSL